MSLPRHVPYTILLSYIFWLTGNYNKQFTVGIRIHQIRLKWCWCNNLLPRRGVRFTDTSPVYTTHHMSGGKSWLVMRHIGTVLMYTRTWCDAQHFVAWSSGCAVLYHLYKLVPQGRALGPSRDASRYLCVQCASRTHNGGTCGVSRLSPHPSQQQQRTTTNSQLHLSVCSVALVQNAQQNWAWSPRPLRRGAITFQLRAPSVCASLSRLYLFPRPCPPPKNRSMIF